MNWLELIVVYCIVGLAVVGFLACQLDPRPDCGCDNCRPWRNGGTP